MTRYSEDPLAPSNFVRIADKGRTEQARVLLAGATPPWCISPSLSLRHSSCSGRNRILLFKSGLKCVFCHILAQSLFFKAPYVWDDRRPRPRAK